MNQYKEDVEIDLVRLFKYLLYKINKMVLLFIVLGLCWV